MKRSVAMLFLLVAVVLLIAAVDESSTKSAGSSQFPQFFVGSGRPQKVTEPGRQFPIVDRAGLLSFWSLFDAE